MLRLDIPTFGEKSSVLLGQVAQDLPSLPAAADCKVGC